MSYISPVNQYRAVKQITTNYTVTNADLGCLIIFNATTTTTLTINATNILTDENSYPVSGMNFWVTNVGTAIVNLNISDGFYVPGGNAGYLAVLSANQSTVIRKFTYISLPNSSTPIVWTAGEWLIDDGKLIQSGIATNVPITNFKTVSYPIIYTANPIITTTLCNVPSQPSAAIYINSISVSEFVIANGSTISINVFWQAIPSC